MGYAGGAPLRYVLGAAPRQRHDVRQRLTLLGEVPLHLAGAVHLGGGGVGVVPPVQGEGCAQGGERQGTAAGGRVSACKAACLEGGLPGYICAII